MKPQTIGFESPQNAQSKSGDLQKSMTNRLCGLRGRPGSPRRSRGTPRLKNCTKNNLLYHLGDILRRPQDNMHGRVGSEVLECNSACPWLDHDMRCILQKTWPRSLISDYTLDTTNAGYGKDDVTTKRDLANGSKTLHQSPRDLNLPSAAAERSVLDICGIWRASSPDAPSESSEASGVLSLACGEDSEGQWGGP